ncbi:MAG: aldehyde dehydrogenase family protein [Vagococcus sp.]
MNDTVEEIIERQRSFFKEGTTRTLSFRVKQLKLLKKQLMSYELELLEALSKDLGKSSMEGFMTEIGLVYRHLDQMITKLPKWGSKKKVRTPLFLWPSTSFIEPTPYGNCLIISPFNYPVLLTLDPLIGAIAGGNTALVGMSEHTPYTNIILSTIIRDTFLPDYVHCYTSNKETNQLVLEYQFDKLFFTGSESVGKIVLEKAAKHLTPTTLELGGKSPVIVTAYADIELAAQRIIWGKFINAGQTCVAPDYCLVDAKIKGELLEEMGRTITQFFGDSPKDSPDYARLINKEACHRIQGLIERDRSLIYMGGMWMSHHCMYRPLYCMGKYQPI